MTAGIRPSLGAEHARIYGVGAYRPSRIVTNAEIVERIDSSDEWIRERSGIVERRWAADDESVTDMAVQAAGKALAHAGVAPEQVGAVIVSTVTHLLQTPSSSADVAHRLGAASAAAFDVSAACAGFCYGVGLANDMVRGGSASYVLVIGVEKLSDITDPEDRSTAFIFGDGAGAVVIGPAEEPGIGPTIWGADGSQLDAIEQNTPWSVYKTNPEAAFPTLRMAGQQVFRWAVYQMAPVARRALDAAGIRAEDLDAFIPHQANMRITDAMIKALQLPDHVVVARDIATTGNTSAASIPLAMSRMLEAGEVKSGGTALLIGFGAGLVYAAQVVTLP
ncbi:MAG TPA: beta-ketoacyl-ACP synthase III [Actinomycetes bacterium]|nr:beta-ketoacyl-ACP synthase III [Actinomycetes bacterium]